MIRTLSRFKYLSLIVALAALPMTVHAQRIVAPGANATVAQTSITSSGALQIVVPIQVSPGINGLQPNLSLVYNSESGYGALGVGWTLSGISKITRCPKTEAQDGARSAIMTVSNDAYCLDGERLVPISGVSGANGTQYRTERETFASIVSNGATSMGTGPTSFVVTTKSGQVWTYGTYTYTGYSITKVADRFGNVMNFYYSAGGVDDTELSMGMTAHGSNFISSIVYAGKVIEFKWLSPVAYNPIPQFQGGKIIERPVTTLQSISLKDSPSFPMYRIKYETLASNYAPARVTKIEQCAGTILKCLPAANFAWDANDWRSVTGANTASLFATAKTMTGFPDQNGNYSNYFVDLNGHGKKSWIKIGNTLNDAWLGKANADASFTTAANWTSVPGVGNTGSYEHYFADVNGDGKADWIRVSRTTNEAWVALGAGDGAFNFWTKHMTTIGSAASTAHYFADVNGDGRSDWIQINLSTKKTQTGYATGGGDFQFATARVPDFDPAIWDLRFADMNGDGRADVMAINKTLPYFATYYATANGTYTNVVATSTVYDAGTRIDIADANGDGLTDFAIMYPVNAPSGKTGLDYVLTGGETSSAKLGNFGASLGSDYFADISGDGLTSRISLGANSTGFVNIGISSTYCIACTSPINIQFTLPSNSPASNFNHYFVDLNGDGKADWIIVDKNSNTASVAPSQFTYFGRVQSVTNGLGATTQVTYKPFSDATVYTADADAVYPQTDSLLPVRSQVKPRLLVASVAQSNGVDAGVTTSYNYGGLKTDMARWQRLGFRWVQSTNQQTSIVNRTEFLQTFPYTGLTSVGTKSLAGSGNNGILEQTTNTYTCNDFVNATSCVTATNRRYFPYAKQSVSSSWDLTGAPISSSNTTYQYDVNGNLTQSIVTVGSYTSTTVTTYRSDGQPLTTTVTNSQ
ncbi:FG-GAP-like repeat-containing protein [Undibacterium sp. Ji22W]|uniref:FG-GAP-like repeat-containing protein n=1 Tax=Undibacterium sp. Ji22W TaxID=3413038 RepID=UPI003BF258F6